ncbi:MAG TPA: hypothetical protein VIH99_08235, partial [Bdellovibrionota bacterium]|jgi:hypothetical protein
LRSSADYERLLRDSGAELATMGKNDFSFSRRSTIASTSILRTIRLFGLLWGSAREFLFGQPIFRLGKYNTRSEAFLLTFKILESFQEEIRRAGAIPWILLFPLKTDLVSNKSGGKLPYQPLRELLEQRKYSVLDLSEAFSQSDSLPTLFTKGHHFNGAGNRLVADYLARKIRVQSANGPASEDR